MRVLALILSTLVLTDCNMFKSSLNSPEDVCVYFPDGALLRQPGSCTEIIKCQDGKSLPQTKCSGDKIAKLDKMTCVTASSKTTDKYCTVACAKTSPMFIEDAKNCQDWTKCEAGKVIDRGSCPDGQIFDKTSQSCIYDNGVCDKTYSICNVAKTNQRFWDKKNCQKYYYCNEKQVLVSEKCPPATYYEVSTGNCVKKPQETCHTHPVPDEPCGTKKRALLNRFISDQTTCRGYFYCKDLGRSADGNYIPDESPDWGQCLPGQFFDADLEYCRYKNNVKCEQDRCDGNNSGMVLSETPGCQHYLICKDGYTVEEVKCADNKYFDPVVEDCVDAPVSYPICN